ncbi:MAG: DUF4258 domain-containing protein [Nitrospirae bacterium]|nr:DUF4258 domain-containing protein [Nitrospirota bacterium]
MDYSAIEQLIRSNLASGQYQSRVHALQRINERGILPHEVKEALLTCKVIEDYPHDKRGHSCLVWGKTSQGRDLHAVCGFSEDVLWIITIYEPDPIEWETPEKRRFAK